MKKLEKSFAGFASGFLSIAAWILAHYEAPQYPWIWAVVVFALLFSAPSVAGWARTWTGSQRILSPVKAIGFTALLESVLVVSHTQWLSITSLVLLAGINAMVAVAAMSATKRVGSIAVVKAPAPRPVRQRPAKTLPVASAVVVG